MRPLRIGLSGPGGVGKTSVAKAMDTLDDYSRINTSGRIIYTEFDVRNHAEVIDKSMRDVEFAQDFQYRMLSVRNEILANKQGFITDRTPWDNMVYYSVQVLPRVLQEDAEQYFEMALDSLVRNYDLIYLVDFFNDEPLEEDGVRNTSLIYNGVLMSLYNHYVPLLNQAFHNAGKTNRILTLPAGTVDERVHHILDHIVKNPYL